MYGYLPALMNTVGYVLLPVKYREIVNSRPELRQYGQQVDWQADADAALKKSTGVVIALPPAQQRNVVDQIIHYPELKKFILEKPVAPSADLAIALVDNLRLNMKRLRVGYAFSYTDWFNELLRLTRSGGAGKIILRWEFRADHFAKNRLVWKRSHFNGGGPLRFYGIHFVAAFAELGYQEAISSTLSGGANLDQSANWCASFRGTDRPPLEVVVYSNANASRFQIYRDQAQAEQPSVWQSEGPMPTRTPSELADSRVPILEKIIKSFSLADVNFFRVYQDVNALWKSVETATIWKKI